MTKQSEILGDPKYLPVLDHGFIGIRDYMGSDDAVVTAARLSYGAGTKKTNTNRNLLRYLLRMHHTGPFEMNEVIFHLRAPIFVLRQLFRHRTHSANEESARYSIISDDFYIPTPDAIKMQSTDNKQGRSGDVDEVSRNGILKMLNDTYAHSYNVYETLLGKRPAVDENIEDDEEREHFKPAYDAYNENDRLLSDDFDGVARELARTVLPVATYSELQWKQNLWNLMHLMKLRLDPHAQMEIRVYAQAMYDLLQPLYPECIQAFEDYIRCAVTSSRMEVNILLFLLANSGLSAKVTLADHIEMIGGEKIFAAQNDMSVRELREFREKWNL